MDEKNFKVSMSCYDKTITVNRDHSDVSIFEAIEDVATCLLGLTFSKSQIIKGFSEYVEENTKK